MNEQTMKLCQGITGARMTVQTLRDQFAMAAMVALLPKINGESFEYIAAKQAYRVADAMLAERAKEQGK